MKITQAVAIVVLPGIRWVKWIQAPQNFNTIRHTVVIGVAVVGIGTVVLFLQVGSAVTVKVGVGDESEFGFLSIGF